MTLHSPRRTKRGIYFASTLLITVVVTLVITAAIFAVRGNLEASQHLTTGDTALKAAESGIRYAQTKLSANPAWKGDDNRITVNQDDLIIEENNGHVVGIVKSPDGGFAQFRLRFNRQDDSYENLDGLTDSPHSVVVTHPYISVNNIPGGSPDFVPRADGPNFSVTAGSKRPYQVPPGTACLIVEGRAGSGLGTLSATNLNPTITSGSVTDRVVEINLQVDRQPGADAAAMAAGNVTTQLFGTDDKSQMTVSSKTGIPRVRSKKKIEIKNGAGDQNYVSENGEVLSHDGQLHASAGSQSSITANFEDADAGFYKLAWDDVKKAGVGDTTLAAGTYVVWDDGSIHYYDKSYHDYVAHIEANPTDPGIIPAIDADTVSMEIKGKKAKLTITQNILVTDTANTNEFNLIPRKGAKEDPDDTGGDGSYGGNAVAEGEKLLEIVPVPVTTAFPHHTASWTVPLVTSFVGAPILADDGVAVRPGEPGNWWGLTLTDNGDGTGTLLLNDLEMQDLSVFPDVNPQAALTDAVTRLHNQGDPNFAHMLTLISRSGGGMNDIDLGTITPVLRADDIELNFKPASGQTAILSANGDINIASRVKGVGGSLTSQGNIKFVGAGSDLSATIEDGLNLYAKGDIVLSSLLPKSDGSYDYKDFKMKGVIYAWGNFVAKIGNEDPNVKKWGKFDLKGALVAYGNRDKAELGDPGDGNGGNIDIMAHSVKLEFDAAYLTAIQQAIDPGPVKQTFYTVY